MTTVLISKALMKAGIRPLFQSHSKLTAFNHTGDHFETDHEVLAADIRISLQFAAVPYFAAKASQCTDVLYSTEAR